MGCFLFSVIFVITILSYTYFCFISGFLVISDESRHSTLNHDDPSPHKRCPGSQFCNTHQSGTFQAKAFIKGRTKTLCSQILLQSVRYFTVSKDIIMCQSVSELERELRVSYERYDMFVLLISSLYFEQAVSLLAIPFAYHFVISQGPHRRTNDCFPRGLNLTCRSMTGHYPKIVLS